MVLDFEDAQDRISAQELRYVLDPIILLSRQKRLDEIRALEQVRAKHPRTRLAGFLRKLATWTDLPPLE